MPISINGKNVDSITLTGTEPEFTHGYGVFETLRSYYGRPFHIQEHLDRLRQSAADMQLTIAPDDATLTKWITNHCVGVQTPTDDLRLKIIAAVDRIYILSQPLSVDPDIYNIGVSVDLQTVERWQPTVKSLSYYQEYLAHERAAAAGHHDALLMNHNQEITEGAYANFFCVKNDVISTARYSILQGITRNIVISLLEPYYTVEQRKVLLDEVMIADECFLSQTSTGILPVVKIDNHIIGTGKPGPITQQAMTMFEEYVQTDH